ncbi:MAG: M48 family metallopeptidase [Pseudomonadota bacterium]|jgi:Zn-dependent protease with chaperone function|nr:MAG: peptidase M48 [Pseudomonadota bacterium]
MHWLTLLFLLVLAARTAVRIWLASRQIAAVRAHRDHVPAPFSERVGLEQHRKAADYTAARTRLRLCEVVVDAAVLLAFTLGGGISWVDSTVGRLDLGTPWHGVLVILCVLLFISVIELPFSIWRTFGIEARFGFNRMTPGLFIADLVRGLVLALVIGVPLLLAVLALMEHAGAWWWLAVWGVWLAFTLALTWAWPRFIAPLFNRFEPLTDEELKKRVEALVARCGFTPQGVFVMNGSRRSTHGNAYFAGFGRNKRIVLFDTLLERLETAEVEAVLAHELGHFRLRHIARRLVLSAAASLAGLALLAWLAEQPWFYAALGVHVPSTHTALLLFLLVAPVFTYFTTPIAAWWSRRDEFAADEFAARHADARQLASALVKLYRDNASTLTPDRLHSAFYDSHPPPLARIARLEASAARS